MKLASDKLTSNTTLDTWKPTKGNKRTTRYSFEITKELAEKLEARVMAEQIRHNKRVSTSSIIRQALKEYLK